MKNLQIQRDIPIKFAVLAPILAAAVPYVHLFLTSGKQTGFIYGESGYIEVMTVIFLILAVVLALLVRSRLGLDTKRWFKSWVNIFIIGCVYFAGEEVSWGQHLFSDRLLWETPKAWIDINDQMETNLHNVSPLFDQLPRTILTLISLIGGIIIPIYIKAKNITLPIKEPWYWFLPTLTCVPVCVLANLVSIHEKSYKFFAAEIPEIIDIRTGEVKEYLLSLFLLLYITSIYKRHKAI